MGIMKFIPTLLGLLLAGLLLAGLIAAEASPPLAPAPAKLASVCLEMVAPHGGEEAAAVGAAGTRAFGVRRRSEDTMNSIRCLPRCGASESRLRPNALENSSAGNLGALSPSSACVCLVKGTCANALLDFSR